MLGKLAEYFYNHINKNGYFYSHATLKTYRMAYGY